MRIASEYDSHYFASIPLSPWIYSAAHHFHELINHMMRMLPQLCSRFVKNKRFIMRKTLIYFVYQYECFFWKTWLYFVQHSFFLALARNCQIWLVTDVDFCINFHHLPNLDNGNFLAFPLNIFCILAKEHFQILLCNPYVKKLWWPFSRGKSNSSYFWLFSIFSFWFFIVMGRGSSPLKTGFSEKAAP